MLSSPLRRHPPRPARGEMNAFGDVLEPRATPESRLPAHRVGATTRCAASAHRSVLENQAIPQRRRETASASNPAFVAHHPQLFDDELALLVLLALLERFLLAGQTRAAAPSGTPAWARDGSAAHIFPAEDGLADVAVDVADRVQPGDEDALLPRPLGHVDAGTAARGVSGVRGRKPAPAGPRGGLAHRLLKR